MNISELAQEMGVSQSDANAFVECLRVWINKGYSIEEAIERHMNQMNKLVDHACTLPKEIAVEAFYG